MIGTLTLPSGTSMQFTPGNRFSAARATGSGHKMSFAVRFPCEAALHAFTEMAPAVDGRRAASLYEVLRVNRNASPVEIKTAYRSLAKMYHPDSSQSESNGRDFMKIHNAYATLSDPSAREVYDLTLIASSSRRRSFGYSMGGRRSGFYTTRRWETDQCW